MLYMQWSSSLLNFSALFFYAFLFPWLSNFHTNPPIGRIIVAWGVGVGVEGVDGESSLDKNKSPESRNFKDSHQVFYQWLTWRGVVTPA